MIRWKLYPTAIAGVMLVACGGDSTGPSLPNVAGSYSATYEIAFSNSEEGISESDSGTMSINRPRADGHFTGSYTMGGTSSGTIAGTVRQDGGISISQFGDPNADPLESARYLQNIFYWCDFGSAAGAPMTGVFQGNRLSFGGSVSLPCFYTDGVQTFEVGSVISVSVVGFK